MALTPGDVTQFLRDYADVNILLDNVQFTQDDIEKAMSMVTSRYNLLSPTTTYTPDTFPNEWLFLIGVCSHLMHSEAFLQLRNQADYQDGDVQNPGIDNKFTAYKQLSDALAADWTGNAQKLKQQMNMEGCYDSLSSGYRYLRTGMRNIV
jgi:hypothetical protein